jgi:putative DNA primase/helicase
MALWVVHAHALAAFGVNPRIALLSPEKRCGKSSAIDLFGMMVPRPLRTSNISPSAIFRVVEKVSPTLLLDEVDSFQDVDEELRGILNSGHTQAAAQVIRNVGDNHEPRAFSTWSPMILAAIGGLPDTLEDRSIIVRMQRKKKTDTVQRLTQKAKNSIVFKEEVDAIRRECVRWAADHLTELAESDPDIIEALSDRANDNWSGLLAIAELCGGDWLSKAKVSALARSGKAASSDTIGEEMLRDIQAMFETKGTDSISSSDLCEALVGLEEKPWSTWSRGKPITMRKVANLLGKYGIQSQPIRGGVEVAKGYYRANFEEAWERYLSFSSPVSQDSMSYSVTTCMDKGQTPDFQRVTKGGCNSSKNGTLANTGAGCDAVTLQNPESQGKEEKAGGTSVLSYGEEDEFYVDV